MPTPHCAPASTGPLSDKDARSAELARAAAHRKPLPAQHTSPTTPALQLVPVTPAIAALIHQLQQEALEATHAHERGGITLKASGAWGQPWVMDADYQRATNDDDDASIYLLRSFLRPGEWTGRESRRDAQGRRWERRLVAITDDFGDLVEVAA